MDQVDQMDLTRPKWTELGWNGPKWIELDWTEVEWIEWDQNGSSRLKYIEVDWIGPKCYANVTQEEYSNNQYCDIIFRYYI